MKSSAFESKSIRSRNSRLSQPWSSAEPYQIATHPFLIDSDAELSRAEAHEKFGVWNGPKTERRCSAQDLYENKAWLILWDL